MKKWKQIVCGFLTGILFTVSGCASKVQKFKPETFGISEAINTAEFENIVSDTLLFSTSLHTFYAIKNEIFEDETLSENEKAENSTMNYLAYLESVYDIAYTRVSLDLDDIDVLSESYLTYLIMLQVYTEVYVQELDYFQDHAVTDKEYLNHDLIVALSELEDYYVSIMEMIEE